MSLHGEKKLYYARVYEKGTTYSRGYFERMEDAENAVKEIRRLLNSGLDPRIHLPTELPGQRGRIGA